MLSLLFIDLNFLVYIYKKIVFNIYFHIVLKRELNRIFVCELRFSSLFSSNCLDASDSLSAIFVKRS